MTTTRPHRHGDRKPEPADAPRRIPDPAPTGDTTTTAAASQAGQDPPSGRLAYSVDEAARLTGLSRDLLYDEMRRGNLAYVKVGRRRLITRQHLRQFLGIAS
jgi:excisionase family DNA binding protein